MGILSWTCCRHHEWYCMELFFCRFAESRYKRLTVGVVLLLAVDLIWVASAELTQYIFKHEDFDKPFFSTYFKTTMLALYLFGFTFHRPWQYQCIVCLSAKFQGSPSQLQSEVERTTRNADLASSRHINPALIAVRESCHSSRSTSPCPEHPALSDPVFENMTDDDISTTGSEDIAEKNQRHVKFSRVREIRHLGGESAEAERLARMSHRAITDLQLMLNSVSQKLPLLEVAKLSFVFSFLWISANFFYQFALSRTTAAVTNILSSSSGTGFQHLSCFSDIFSFFATRLFTLILAAVFQGSPLDKFTISKLLAVLVSFAGLGLVFWSDQRLKEGEVNYGAIFALVGALLYAVYLVFLKRKAGSEDNLDIPLFFGFVGLFGAILFWPAFFVLHFTGIEQFSLPRDLQTWGFLVLNGLVGTVLSELLWLWGCFLTSSLIGTLSLGLIIPLTMVCDMIIAKVRFSWMFVGGVIPVFLAFFATSVLAHYDDWDPIADWCRKLKTICLRRLKSSESRSLESEQTERLITVDANSFNEDGYPGETFES